MSVWLVLSLAAASLAPFAGGLCYPNDTQVSKAGKTYTCKEGKTWTNGVRVKLTESALTKLDAVDPDTGYQKGAVITDCSGDDDNPDIFTQDITCADGCAPLPSDYTMYWEPRYNPQSATTGLDEAPIKPVKNFTVAVNCRDGYAPKNGNGQTNSAYCSDNGWVPALTNLATCASGCKDIRNEVQYGSSDTLRSTELGGTPFNIGDVITFKCDKGYSLSGSQYVTCSSTQTWNPETLPRCAKATGDLPTTTTTSVTSSAEGLLLDAMTTTLTITILILNGF